MGKRGIVFVSTIALMLLCGCATQERTTAVAGLTESDVRPAALPTDLVGTWNGSFWSIGAHGASRTGTITLNIKDDGSYTLTRGASARSESGVVVANGRTVTLRSSSGAWTPLTHQGETLYGMGPDASGMAIQMSVSKDSGALASPASAVNDHQAPSISEDSGALASPASAVNDHQAP
jgi:hypothetical protein